ncbi:MAG: deoxyribodipyrimidine photo-lyase [Alphaproteobacteria bacterium]|nr:MAG: deoxyribodipyrimidine photo-lyase [Alphaproteobacteria bacterium]
MKHYTFLKQSLDDLNEDLEKLGQTLIIEKNNAIEVFKEYKEKYDIKTVWSHQETWNYWVKQRNNKLSEWFSSNNIRWIEFVQNGVIRNLKSREGWAKKWNSRMNKKVFSTVTQLEKTSDKIYKIPAPKELGLKEEKNTNFILGGRKEGLKLLKSFLYYKGKNYSVEMSSPITAIESCSKLSAHISFGNLSIKEIFQMANKRIEILKNHSSKENKVWIKSIRSFLKRLHWHCHFIQKLEDDPTIEFKNMHSLYDGLREEEFNDKFFYAWKNGITGFPFLDACMRSLKFNGWINFRMRAMLMSFASYHLWLHWKNTADFLATLFIDYEPGIHYTQSQMQSGTTGINSIRIYNPIKQGKDHDPEGLFIKKWIPELSNIPKKDIHTPWLSEVKLKNYPLPIVDESTARKEAAKKIYNVRNSKKFKEESKNIYLKHGSRKINFKIKIKAKNLAIIQIN